MSNTVVKDCAIHLLSKGHFITCSSNLFERLLVMELAPHNATRKPCLSAKLFLLSNLVAAYGHNCMFHLIQTLRTESSNPLHVKVLGTEISFHAFSLLENTSSSLLLPNQMYFSDLKWFLLLASGLFTGGPPVPPNAGSKMTTQACRQCITADTELYHYSVIKQLLKYFNVL